MRFRLEQWFFRLGCALFGHDWGSWMLRHPILEDGRGARRYEQGCFRCWAVRGRWGP